MKSFINVIKGFRATKKTAQMVILLFILNLAFSVILAVPMVQSLKESFGDSLVGERMANGFDFLWWEEYRDQSEGLEKTFTPSLIGKGAILNNFESLVLMTFFNLPPVILILGLLYIIVRTFLAGGIVSIFNMSIPKFSLKKFFGEAAGYFFRFFQVMLVSWLLFFGFLGFLFRLFGGIRNNVGQRSFSEITPFVLGLFFSALILFLLFFIQMVFDYARIHIVVDDRTNILTAIRDTLRFVFKHPGSTLALFYTLVLVNLGVTLIYILLKNLIPQTSSFGVLAAFILQQFFIFTLIGIRCWLYAGEIELYKYWR